MAGGRVAGGGVASRLLLCADVVVEGVHFEAGTPPADVGWKALTVNISDIAAMGGTPTAAVVTVCAPPGTDLDALHRGIGEAALVYGCPLVGGDLSAGPALIVSVTVLGATAATGPVRRSGARPGDAVWVTGPLGGAAAAGFPPRGVRARLTEGAAAAAAGATAMIDVSDGFAADLGHILDMSGVGAVLDEVPVAVGATLLQALGGGEDFELVICGPDALGEAVVGLIRIGTIVEDPRIRTLGGAPLDAVGWEHRL